MALADIAEGIRSVEKQQHRDVAVVDAAGTSLADRLETCASDLPCSPPEAASLARQFAGGAPVERCAETVGVTRTVAVKTLHLLGFSGVVTVDRDDRTVVRRWIDGEIDRTTVRRRTGLDESTFALAVYVETHEPLAAAQAVLDPARTTTDGDPTDQQRALQETMSDPTDFQTLAGGLPSSRR